jgi:uncharacterized membrane protein
MKKFFNFIFSRVLAGVLILAPIYLALLLLLKAMQSLTKLVMPLAKLVPAALPADKILSLLLVLVICFITGSAIRNRKGRALWEKMEKSIFQKIPGYTVVRSLTRQFAGETQNEAWKPALAEIEDALVPAFIIEELEDGRLTIFVPSVPTAFAGAIYILAPERVHRVSLPVTSAIRAVSRWGSGSKDLIAAMEDQNKITD